jgi:hypothetical protein
MEQKPRSSRISSRIPASRSGASAAREHKKRPQHHYLDEALHEGAVEKKSAPMLVIAIVAGLAVAGGGAWFVLGRGGAEPTPAVVEKPKADAPPATRPKSADDDVFSLGSASATPEDSSQQTETRVIGREPRTVEMKELVEHLGRLYTTPPTEKSILELRAKVDDYYKRRVDLPADAQAEYTRLVEVTDKERIDPFLSEADSELAAINNFLSKREIHKRDHDGKLYPQPFKGFTMKPYIFFVQVAQEGREAEIAKECQDQLSQLKEDFLLSFGKFLKLDEKKNSKSIKVILLRNGADYDAYNRIKDPKRDKNLAVAHYEPDSRRLVVPLDIGGAFPGTDPQYVRRAVMFHEGTHQLIHCFSDHQHLSSYGAMWSDEGVAEYFGGHTVDKNGKYQFRKINMARLSGVVQLGMGPTNRIDLIKLVKWTRATQAEEEEKNFAATAMITSQVYALGWAFVEFLNSFDNGKYEDKFEQIMREQFNQGDTGLPILRRLFTEEEFDKIQQEFHVFLDEIVKAAKEHRIYDGAIQKTPEPK